MAVEYVADKLGTTMKPGWSFNITPALKHWILEKKSIELGRPFDDLIKQGGIKATNYDFSEQIGTNYAVSNARASKGDAVPDFLLFNYFQLKNQVRTLVRHHPDISTEDLLFVMIGGNDIMAALFNKNPTALVDESITEICNAIEFLATNSSLQYIVIANVPDIGLIPRFVNTDLQKLATNLSQDFNQKLVEAIKDFNRKFPKIKIKLFDIESIFKSLISDYVKKGYNTEQACVTDIADHQNFIDLLELLLKDRLDAAYNCGCNEEKILQYLFFDFFHPTKLPHQTVGDRLYNFIVSR